MFRLIRKLIQFCLMVSYLGILWFFCPVEMLYLAYKGVIGASIITHFVLFLSAMFLGRAFCGWLCPNGAFLNSFSKNVKSLKKINLLFKPRPLLWGFFYTSCLVIFIFRGGIREINYFYGTKYLLQLDRPYWLIFVNIFFIIYTFLLSLLIRAREWCKNWCPISFPLILGMKLGRKLKLPLLKIGFNSESCSSCNRCIRECSMELDPKCVKSEKCTLCRECIDVCKKGALLYVYTH